MAPNTQTLTQWFKEIFEPRYKSLVPEFGKMITLAGFKSSAKIGENYNVGVVLGNENGVTFAAPKSGAYALKQARGLTTDRATVDAFSMSMRCQLATQDMSRAASDKQAFADVVGLVVENSVQSMNKFVEVNLLYGQTSKGRIEANAVTNTAANVVVLTFTDANWSGIWGGSEGMAIELFDATVATNVDVTLGHMVITAVDFDAQTVTAETKDAAGAPANTAGAIVAAAAGVVTNVLFAGSKISGGAWQEGLGYSGAMQSATSLWGISNGYSMWKGNNVSIGANLDLETTIKALNIPIQKGLNESATMFVGPLVWAMLNADETGFRRYPVEKTKTSAGYEAITYHSQCGKVEIVGHPFMKQSEAFVFPTSAPSRIGSSDVRFNSPTGKDSEYFNYLQDYEGYEMRLFSDQALFLDKIARCSRFYGITF